MARYNVGTNADEYRVISTGTWTTFRGSCCNVEYQLEFVIYLPFGVETELFNFIIDSTKLLLITNIFCAVKFFVKINCRINGRSAIKADSFVWTTKPV